MPYTIGESREQLTLMPLCLDDYIGENSVCRMIDAYVNSLDMAALGFKYAETKATGRPPFDPADMLKLYVYGYMNRVRSSRRLEAEAQRNVEVIWLLGKLTPDDKTICNFRKDNPVALKKTFREFSLWCVKQGLCDRELAAVDGTKIRANANRHSIHTEKGTEKMLSEVNEKIERYLKLLDETDANEADETKLSAENVKSILAHLSEQKAKLAVQKAEIEANYGKEISTIDPDAHLMHTNGDGRNLDACYNVQAVAEPKNGLILDFDVTICPDDKGALPKMAESAKKILGVQTLDVSGDKGYYDGGDAAECEQNGVTAYVPKVADHSHAPDRNYDKSNFKYDVENDCYTCPEGNAVPFNRLQKRPDVGIDRLYQNRKLCPNCPNREKCTINKSGRIISRNSNQDALDRNNARMATDAGREKYKTRSSTIEHIFGTVKAVWGYRQFLCRTRERTTAETSLAFLAYNLRRGVNIFKANGGDLVKAMA
jgi:transposase